MKKLTSSVFGEARSSEPKLGADRSFGIVFAIAFSIIGIWPLSTGGSLRSWALFMGFLFFLAAFFAPSILRPLNRVWFRLSVMLGRITNPIVMGIIFFAAVLPTALLSQLLRKDPLQLKIDRSAKSYWILRAPPGPDPETMRNQF